MTDSKSPDPIDKAIGQAQQAQPVQIVSRQVPLQRPDGTVSGFVIGLPADLREADFLAISESIVQFAREVQLMAAQKARGGLVLARGNVPPRPIS